MEHIIIIGGVAAGAKAASKIRRENPHVKISIYNEGKFISYSACGLPYFIENLIEKPEKLLIRSPKDFENKYKVNVFTEHRVTKILPNKHQVEIIDLKTSEKSTEQYSKLLIAMGAHVCIPDIEGTDLKNVHILKSIEDAIAIKDKVPKCKKVIIVGGGYIGIELGEAFVYGGMDTTIIEMGPDILSHLDDEMSQEVHTYLTHEKNMHIITNNRVTKLVDNSEGKVCGVETESGKKLECDLVILSAGVGPNIDIAKDAGIAIGKTGAIKIDSRMQTNVRDIYAAGDCTEQINMITNKPVWVPLGSTANKQGRIAAINMTGGDAEFKGILGSSITKAFEYSMAKTGINAKEAENLGYNYVCETITNKDRSGYIPGAENITIKLIADKDSKKLLGAQIIGKGDTDKRINVIATALTAGMTVEEFQHIDLTYSPLFSTSIDPIIVATYELLKKL